MAALVLIPHKDAILLNLKLGFTLGLSWTLLNILTLYARRKLTIPEALTPRYLGLLLLIGITIVSAYFCLLTLFGPDYATRVALYDNSIEEIGFGFAVALVIIGQLATHLALKPLFTKLVNLHSEADEAVD